MIKNPSTFNFIVSSDDEEANDIVTIQFSSSNIEINYYQLMKWSRLVREQYRKEEMNRLSDYLKQYQQRYNIKEGNIKSFFKSISDEQVQITNEQFFDYQKLSKIFKISKFDKILHQYFQKHKNDLDFVIRAIKDQISSQNNNIDKNDICNQISSDMEDLLSNSIDECFKNQEFNEFPVSKVYRIIEKSDKKISSDSLYDFIKKSLNERYTLFTFLIIKDLSDEKFNDLCETYSNGGFSKTYFQYLQCDLSYLKEIKDEKNEMRNKIKELNNENKQNKMEKINLQGNQTIKK